MVCGMDGRVGKRDKNRYDRSVHHAESFLLLVSNCVLTDFGPLGTGINALSNARKHRLKLFSFAELDFR